jgi:hypothetical protein
MNNRIWLSLICLPLLGGCLPTPQSSSSIPVVNSNIREINLMPMGSDKYNLQIRGNVYSEQNDLRKQFTQEVQGVCSGDYEIENIETKDISHQGHKKPMVEGNFRCK